MAVTACRPQQTCPYCSWSFFTLSLSIHMLKKNMYKHYTASMKNQFSWPSQCILMSCRHSHVFLFDQCNLSQDAVWDKECTRQINECVLNDVKSFCSHFVPCQCELATHPPVHVHPALFGVKSVYHLITFCGCACSNFFFFTFALGFKL